MNKFPSKCPEPAPQDRSFICEIHQKLGCKDELTKSFIAVVLIMIRVFDTKQCSYGPGNVAEFGETGVMIRATDKIKRIINLWRTGQKPINESIDDSYGDLAVYSAIALMCRWGLWPGVKNGN